MASSISESNSKYINLYTTKAHVFRINPQTKTSWIQIGVHAIPISFVGTLTTMDDANNNDSGESSLGELRIIGVDDTGEQVLNALILPKTAFTKRSQKFGQWVDQANTVHGMGFDSESELAEFVETFQQLQRKIISDSQPNLQQKPHHHQTSSSISMGANHQALQGDQPTNRTQQQINSNNISETNGRYQPGNIQTSTTMHQQFSNTLAHPGHQVKRQQQQLQQHQQTAQNLTSNGNTSLNNGNSETNIAAYPRSQSMFGLHNKQVNNAGTKDLVSPGGGSPDTENSSLINQDEWKLREQLKYENERLKQALEESSKNAGIWNSELLNLRTNNVKLTQALQESKAHVKQWERELLNLRDENRDLKSRLSAVETNSDDPEKKHLQEFVDEMQMELRRKDNQIEELQKSMEELELKGNIQQNGDQPNDLSDQIPINSVQKKNLDVINAKLQAKLSELTNIQKEFSQLVDGLHY